MTPLTCMLCALCSRCADGVSFAIPVDAAVDVMRQLREHGRVIRPYVGIKMLQASAALSWLEGGSGVGVGSCPCPMERGACFLWCGARAARGKPELLQARCTRVKPLPCLRRRPSPLQLNKHNAAQFRKRDANFPRVDAGILVRRPDEGGRRGRSWAEVAVRHWAAAAMQDGGHTSAGPSLPGPPLLPAGARRAPRQPRRACWPACWGRHRRWVGLPGQAEVEEEGSEKKRPAAQRQRRGCPARPTPARVFQSHQPHSRCGQGTAPLALCCGSS